MHVCIAVEGSGALLGIANPQLGCLTPGPGTARFQRARLALEIRHSSWQP